MPSEERKELIEKYAQLQKKHGFPLLEDFENEFGMRVVEPIIPNMISIIYEALGRTASHIDAIMTPQRLADTIESEFYTDKEREDLFRFFKELMALMHELMAAYLQPEAERVAALKKCMEFHRTRLKPFAQKFLADQAAKWGKEDKKPSHKKEAYHG